MRKLLVATLGLLLTLPLFAEVWQARYGVAETFDFKLYNADGTLDVDEVDGGTEVSVSCNEGAETTATNDFVDEGTFYSIALTATEMQCERITVVVAATTTEVFFIQTLDNASAMTPMIVQTGDSFARLGVAGAGLTAIDLPDQTMNITGSITGNLSGSVGSVTAVSSGAITEASFATTAGSFEPLGIVDQGTAQGATATTLQLRSAATFADDELNGNEILITGGSAGIGQTRLITDYVSATDTATVATWTTTPSGTITYQVRTDTATGGSVSIGVGGIAANSFAAGAIDATAIATGAIDADAVADNAFDAGAFAANSLTDAKFNSTAGVFYALGVIDQGTAQAATATTLQLRAAAAFANDEILGATCLVTGGSTGVGQSRTVTDYDSATDTATVDAWTTTPTGTITYRCYGTAPSAAGTSLTQADIRTAVGLATPNLDTQLADIESGVDVDTIEGVDATNTLGVAQTGDAFARLGAPAGASVSADIAVIEGQTNDIGVAGAGLTAADDAVMTRLGAPAGASIAADIDAVPTAAENLAASNAALRILTGTCSSGSTTTCVSAALTQATTAQLDDRVICFDDSWCGLITDFTPASDTVTTTKVAPDTRSGKAYTIFPATVQ